MGLTGVILRAAVRLRKVQSGWIRQHLQPTADLGETMDAFEAAQEATYSVAWIDCLSGGRAQGRSLVMLGEHATLEDLSKPQRRKPFDIKTKRKLSVPFSPPAFAMNGLTVRAFNALYYWNGTRNAGQGLVDWDSYFYPLDAILNWNRIYGRRGFAQFQCVLPLESCAPGHAGAAQRDFEGRSGVLSCGAQTHGPAEEPLFLPDGGLHAGARFPGEPGHTDADEPARCDYAGAWWTLLSCQGQPDDGRKP